MKESILNNKWVLGVNSSQDALNVPGEKILKAAPKRWNHLFKKLKGFFTEKFENLKELIDEMSLYPERRF